VYDPISRRLAAATGCVVVVPEYRLAPENPYPAALHDAYAAARGVFAALDARGLPFVRQLSLAGDSAGAALAATVSARSQHDTALQIAAQVLIYPSLDYSMSLPSITENGEGYFNSDRIAWYFDNYFQHGEDRLAASPLHMTVTPRMPPPWWCRPVSTRCATKRYVIWTSCRLRAWCASTCILMI
jgi:acetyl esterase/lipase